MKRRLLFLTKFRPKFLENLQPRNRTMRLNMIQMALTVSDGGRLFKTRTPRSGFQADNAQTFNIARKPLLCADSTAIDAKFRDIFNF